MDTPNKPSTPDGLQHIAIAGNIGAGKTTLTELLAKHFQWIPKFEEVENNPYIDDFYKDMESWSLHMQIYYLNLRFQQALECRKLPKTVIQDRTIEEDAHIFATNLYSMGLMSGRDYKLYQDLFGTISSNLPKPDLLIYLRASIPTLVNRIQKRGREFEDFIRLDYLRRLNTLYDEWIEKYEGNLLIINVDDLDFADNQSHLSHVFDLVQGKVGGLFQF